MIIENRGSVLFGNELEERGRDFVFAGVVVDGDVVAQNLLDGGEGAAGIRAFLVESEVLLLLGLRNEPFLAGGALDFGGVGRKGGA